eukprot:TRINITY_DN10604_c0_g3_i1.p1 TRINITY_DN10604_c0_g3~~TRINITY_DN10604_c0_g3_i1.p1  ORF type:complete len:136 (-),score=19.32 TRINITY_DN10604_c0_g3_i1:929-1336(-)
MQVREVECGVKYNFPSMHRLLKMLVSCQVNMNKRSIEDMMKILAVLLGTNLERFLAGIHTSYFARNRVWARPMTSVLGLHANLEAASSIPSSSLVLRAIAGGLAIRARVMLRETCVLIAQADRMQSNAHVCPCSA